MRNIKITLEDLFNLPGAAIYNPDNYKPVSTVSIDSRNIPSNALFIALKGDKFDGHKFISDVVKKGAKAIVINKSQLNKIKNIDLPIVTVPDTTIALGNISSLWRKKLTAKVIAITGSAGKTSTKEILAQLLKEKYNVNKTTGNNNNHIGVPLTILSTNSKHDALVIELGTNHFGEIQYTSAIIQPDFSLITNINDSHLEYFKSRNGVLKEKSVLMNVTEANNGIVFINNDDKLLNKFGKGFKNKVTYAFNNKADVIGKIIRYNNIGQAELLISYKNKKFSLSIPLLGEQSAKNLLAAVAVSIKFGLSQKDIVNGVGKLSSTDKRLNVKRHSNFLLIDDTYNANPESMRSSLELLGKITLFNKRIAILGDMFELGKNEIQLHKQLISVIKKNKINIIYTIGSRMKHLNELMKSSKFETKHFDSRNSLISFLKKNDIINSAILVKGSRGMKMEEFVKVIEDREL
jgi:UDP-N-acetylmuramoyl-tripeptide--D-alanyl-D-alanine ligase